jgi:transposase, IS5 family
MAHQRIGQERFEFAVSRGCCSSLDDLSRLIDWHPITDLLKAIYVSAKGEAAWPPLVMFKALLLSVWYDLSDVKLAEALDHHFGGSAAFPKPSRRPAFVRFRKALMAAELDRALFKVLSAQLKAKAEDRHDR